MMGNKWNSAALRALIGGDIANAIVASTPGGIEAQEAAGQQEIVSGTQLPSECNRDVFEAMGIVFGERVDELFVEAILPVGWRKEATDHSMHSNLLDDKGRKRAGIFYKAAFYDRRADMHAIRRYSYNVRPVGGWERYDFQGDPAMWKCVVLDCDSVIWESDTIGPEPAKGASREDGLAWYEKKDALGEIGRAWLDEHYPKWKSPLAYWD